MTVDTLVRVLMWSVGAILNSEFLQLGKQPGRCSRYQLALFITYEITKSVLYVKDHASSNPWQINVKYFFVQYLNKDLEAEKREAQHEMSSNIFNCVTIRLEWFRKK